VLRLPAYLQTFIASTNDKDQNKELKWQFATFAMLHLKLKLKETKRLDRAS
jgi:hypothetical protein